MINRNSQCLSKPFLLKPAGKDYLWGGTRLKEQYGKDLNICPLAETWECSVHPDGVSVVGSGVFVGQTLADVLKQHPEFLGQRWQAVGELPVLVKFIDAKQDLSVQVHPDDEYAMRFENGQLGKTEMWYVVEAEPEAQLIYGLQCDATADELRDSIAEGRVSEYLQSVPVKKDDVFFIPAGTIHAIGAGCLIVEVQESSNLTYRLYDYDRIGKDGKKRPLHIDKALAVANLKSSAEPRQPMWVLRYYRGYAKELLCRCKYFETYRWLINAVDRVVAFDHEDGFNIGVVIAGNGRLYCGDETLDIGKGDTFFVPAGSEPVEFAGKLEMLGVRG